MHIIGELKLDILHVLNVLKLKHAALCLYDHSLHYKAHYTLSLL